ncbi:hypothetical protein ACGUFB_07750 [Actinotignum schaalii]|uniref:hypothetical protein n=1 Tax=Actinotignum schaalii TaxID=59505 RepID=UPI00373F86BA
MDREELHNDDNLPWSPVDILIDWIDEHADPELVAKDDGYWLEGKGGGGTPWCLIYALDGASRYGVKIPDDKLIPPIEDIRDELTVHSRRVLNIFLEKIGSSLRV